MGKRLLPWDALWASSVQTEPAPRGERSWETSVWFLLDAVMPRALGETAARSVPISPCVPSEPAPNGWS